MRKSLLSLLLLSVAGPGAGDAFALEALTAPCLRFTDADAGLAFGTAVKHSASDPCRFEAVGDATDYFTVEIQPGQAENSEKLMQPLTRIYGAPDPVRGIGDRAFSFESVLIVLCKKDYFTVSIFSSRLTRRHSDQAAARAIALKVIPLL